jgi:hypothetical protein
VNPKLLLVAKLANPALSCGIRKKNSTIKKRFVIIAIILTSVHDLKK